MASSTESSPAATARPRSAIVRISSSDRSANARSATSPWPAAIVVGAEGDDRLDRGRPVERVAVAEVGRRPVLEEVAGEQDAGVRDRQDDVVVGVAAAEVAQLDGAPADVDRRPLVERARSAA